jgi:hypothetical protein
LSKQDAVFGNIRRGNAQNCPMNIPLTKAIYVENCETVVHGLLVWLKK